MILRERLAALHPGASRRRIKAWLEGSRVRVNDAIVRRGDVPVAPGDRVVLGASPSPVFPALLERVHEDDAILVVVKPAGLLTIASERERERTAHRLLGGYVGGRVFVVHRLDRETSGLLVFAKSPAAKRLLQAQFAARAPERVYAALVEGPVRPREGVLRGRLTTGTPAPVRPTRDPRRGREAITRYRTLAAGPTTTLLELTLVTGRRGQLRAQLAAAGHPIVGDTAYGSVRDPLRRVCLHATRLAFVHPEGRRVVFESPMPSAFRRL